MLELAGPTAPAAALWDVRLFVGGCPGGLEVRNIAADFEPDEPTSLESNVRAAAGPAAGADDRGPGRPRPRLGNGNGGDESESDVDGSPPRRLGVRELVCMPTEDEEYPPQRKVLMMWDLITSRYRHAYEWVIKADTDTYINAWVVDAQFDRGLFDNALHHTMPRYVGIGGVGRTADLGLKAPYCLGMAYALNAAALGLTAGLWQECLASVASNHSDTEVGRCVFRAAHIGCETRPRFFNQLYFTHSDTAISRPVLVHHQVHVSFPARPHRAHFASGFLHPLKSPEECVRPPPKPGPPPRLLSLRRDTLRCHP